MPAQPPSRPTVGDITAKSCPKCGASMAAGAVVCIDCGHNTRLGMNVKTAAAVRRTGKFGATVALAAVVAALGGLAWFGLAYLFSIKIAWLAIGIGAVVGAVMSRVATHMKLRAGVAAALLSLGGIVLGNLLIFEWVALPKAAEGMAAQNAGSHRAMVDRIVRLRLLSGYAPASDEERVARSLLMDEDDGDAPFSVQTVTQALKNPPEYDEDADEELRQSRVYEMYSTVKPQPVFAALEAMNERLRGDLAGPAGREHREAVEKDIKEGYVEFLKVLIPSYWQRIKLTHHWFDWLCMAIAVYVAFQAAASAKG